MKAVNKRDISQSFFDDLKDGSLKPMLELVRNDDTLCLELRGSNVVIYYRGGALYTIYEKQEHVYDISFNENYRTNKDIDKVFIRVPMAIKWHWNRPLYLPVNGSPGNIVLWGERIQF